MPRALKAQKEAKDKLTENDEEALTYELGYLVVPTVAEEQLASEVGALRGSIERSASVPFSEEFPSKRVLSYRVSRSVGGHREHYNEAYFGWVKFDALPSSIEAIKKELDGSETILRYLILKVPRDSATDRGGGVRTGIVRKRTEGYQAKQRKEPEEEKPVPTMSDEDLDKTIEELIG
jgi:ribosomal protein S6